MKPFPKCQALQERACGALCNLSSCSIGKAKAVESGESRSFLPLQPCTWALRALVSIASGRKADNWLLINLGENTRLLISLGGAAAVAKVRTKWPDNSDIQALVRKLAKLIVTEMKTWANEKYGNEGLG
jgi:hypothetical protein